MEKTHMMMAPPMEVVVEVDQLDCLLTKSMAMESLPQKVVTVIPWATVVKVVEVSYQ